MQSTDTFGYECPNCEVLWQALLVDKEDRKTVIPLESNCKLCGTALVGISVADAVKRYEVDLEC